MANKLSILIPCFNEASRIEATLIRIKDYLVAKKLAAEIILFDDGSADETLNILNRLAEQTLRPNGLSVVISGTPVNRGKGYAVREGGKLATGDTILVTDADMSVPIEDLDKLLAFAADYDIVIGSRRADGGNVAVRQPAHRVLMGRMFSKLSRVILRVSVQDFTCGFKIVSRKSAEVIFPRLTIDRWAYDSELLKIAVLSKLSIKEVGVTWRDDRRSKVRLSRDILGSLWGLVVVTARSIAGLYADSR